MKIKVIILIGLILISAGASAALKFDEKINVNGNGYMLSRTNTEQSSDLAEGHGAQIYHRTLSSQLGVSSLNSDYDLKSDNFRKNYNYSLRIDNITINNNTYQAYNLVNSAYSPNRYLISMKSPTGLRHTISVYGLSGEGVENLKSSSSIAFDPAIEPPSSLPTSDYSVTTSYDISGNGSLSEAIADSSLSRHPQNIAETSIFGDFSVNSRLTSALTLPLSEAQDQLAKADSVTPVSDMPQQNKSSLTVSDLERMLNKGLITQDDYLNKLQNLLNLGSITSDQYATSLTSAFNSGLITLSYVDYSDLLQKAASGTLNELNEMVNKTLMTPDEYLTKLKQMLDDNRLNEVDYLMAISKTKTATRVTDVQYSTYKSNTLSEMKNKFLNGVIGWPTYSTRLIVMLNFDLINQTDYDLQIRETSSARISDLEKSLDLGLIDQTDFVGKLKEMRDEGSINETSYNLELSKFNISN